MQPSGDVRWMIGMVVATAAAGCLGRPSFVALEPRDVAGIELVLEGGGRAICGTGAPAHVVAVVTYRDGRRLETWTGRGPRGGKLTIQELVVSAEPGDVDPHGRVVLPRNPLSWLDQPVLVRVAVPERSLAASLTLAPRFDCGGVADYRGRAGTGGGSGGRGERGGPGPHLEVAIAQVDTELNGRLMLVRVRRGGGSPDYYVVDARGPARRFEISAAGGRGGAGGAGMPGMDGMSGSSGSSGLPGDTCGDGGTGGDGGNGGDGSDGGEGGDGGDGGAGGTISVSYPAGRRALVRHLDYDVAGGAGGSPGPGGDGGSGGRGGDGGSGGAGGSPFGDDAHCVTSSGASGQRGSDGRDGFAGPDGAAGRPGRDGRVTFRAADVRDLWAAELAAGIPIVLDDDRVALD